MTRKTSIFHSAITVMVVGVLMIAAVPQVAAQAVIPAGSTVTENVPRGALAIGRSRQRNVLGWVSRKNSRKKRRPSQSPT